jgi:enterobactin synthetase component D
MDRHGVEAAVGAESSARTQMRDLFSDKVSYEVVDVPEFRQALLPPLRDRRALRRMQFDAGRISAKRLLASLGLANADIPANADRSPAWPAGFVGSIAHTDTLVFVAVARQKDLRGLGIDVEPIVSDHLHSEIGSVYLNRAEMSLVRATTNIALASTICFSAKEAFFKAVYPLARRFFDFMDAEVVSLSFESGDISILLTSTLSDEFAAGLPFKGAFHHDVQNVFTSFQLPAPSCAPLQS